MMAINRRCTPSPHLAFASCAAISLLFFAVAAPAPSIAQVGSQTGYQEWVPPGSGDGATDGGGGAAGGDGGAAGEGGGGAAYASGGGAAHANGGGGAYRGDAGSAGGGRDATSATKPAGVGSDRDEGSARANRAGQSTTDLTTHPSEEATGTIPLTRDNILLAAAVAAAAIGAGFGVNRLARRTEGT